MLHRDLRRRHGELNEAPHLLDFALLDTLQRVEVLHFGSDGHGETCGIELCDRSHPAAAGKNVSPRLFRADPESTDQSQACHYYSARQIFIPPGYRYISMQEPARAWANYPKYRSALG